MQGHLPGQATIIAAAVKPPPPAEGQVNLRDPDASCTIKNKKTCFGCKAHPAVDQGSELVRQAEMSPVDLHDSQSGEALIQGDEKACHAGKAYDCKGLRKALTDKGIDDQILHKAPPGKALVQWKKWSTRSPRSCAAASSGRTGR